MRLEVFWKRFHKKEREWDIELRHVHLVTLCHAHDVRIVGGAEDELYRTPCMRIRFCGWTNTQN